MTHNITQNVYDFNVTSIGFIVERHPDPLWGITDMANHDYYIIAVATGGQSNYILDGTEFHVEKGDLIFFQKGLLHSAYSNPDNPWSFFSVGFDLELKNSYSKNKINSFKNFFSTTNFRGLHTLFSELNHIWSGKKPGYIIKCRSLIMELLYIVIRKTDLESFDTPHYHIIDKITDMIQTNYKNTYSIKDLAGLTELSPSHFRLLFKKVTGYTIVQYQNNIKINVSKDHLLSGSCNVTDAARAVGFEDIYYFSRLFKKITGVNPSAYIKR